MSNLPSTTTDKQLHAVMFLVGNMNAPEPTINETQRGELTTKYVNALTPFIDVADLRTPMTLQASFYFGRYVRTENGFEFDRDQRVVRIIVMNVLDALKEDADYAALRDAFIFCFSAKILAHMCDWLLSDAPQDALQRYRLMRVCFHDIYESAFIRRELVPPPHYFAKQMTPQHEEMLLDLYDDVLRECSDSKEFIVVDYVDTDAHVAMMRALHHLDSRHGAILRYTDNAHQFRDSFVRATISDLRTIFSSDDLADGYFDVFAHIASFVKFH